MLFELECGVSAQSKIIADYHDHDIMTMVTIVTMVTVMKMMMSELEQALGLSAMHQLNSMQI